MYFIIDIKKITSAIHSGNIIYNITIKKIVVLRIYNTPLAFIESSKSVLIAKQSNSELVLYYNYIDLPGINISFSIDNITDLTLELSVKLDSISCISDKIAILQRIQQWQ